MEGFDATVQHLRHARDVGHVGDAEAGLTQGTGGPAGGDDLDIQGAEAPGKVDNAGLVGDGEEGAANGGGGVGGHRGLRVGGESGRASVRGRERGVWEGGGYGASSRVSAGMVGVVDPHGAPVLADPTLGEEAQGLRIEAVLHVSDPVGQGLRRVVGVDRHGVLQNDGAVVVLLVDQVHGGAAPVHAVVEDGAVDVHAVHALAPKGGEEGRVDVRHAAPVLVDHGGRNLLHVAREGDEGGVVGGQCLQEGAPKGSGGLERRGLYDDGGDVLPGGPVQGAGGRCIADTAHDLGRQVARINCVQDGLEVGPPPRGKHGETHRADGKSRWNAD